MRALKPVVAIVFTTKKAAPEAPLEAFPANQGDFEAEGKQG
jgi:hypothetical protein